MGWRGKDSLQSVESDLAIQEAPGKKMPGKKAICVRHSRQRKGCSLCVWASGGAGPGMYSFDLGDCVQPLVNFSYPNLKSNRKRNMKPCRFVCIHPTHNY